MAILTSIADFLHRRRRALAYTAVGAGAVWALGKYAQYKVEELAEKAELQRLARENIRRRFEQNQQDSTLTLLSLLPAIGDQLMRAMDVERVTEELKRARTAALRRSPSANSAAASAGANAAAEGSKSTDVVSGASSPIMTEEQRQAKTEMWERLKVFSFARTITAIYASVLLHVLIRIQLNLLGRHTYLDSVEPAVLHHGDKSSTTRGTTTIPFDVERKFLALSWYFLHRGLPQLMAEVQEAVRAVLEDVSLSNRLTYAQLLDVIMRVRKIMELEQVQGGHVDGEKKAANASSVPKSLDTAPSQHSQAPTMRAILRSVILPPEGTEATTIQSGLTQSPTETPSPNVTVTIDEPSLRALLQETRDLVDSPDYAAVVAACLDASFARVEVTLRTLYPSGSEVGEAASGPSSPVPRIREVSGDSGSEAAAALPTKAFAALLPEMSRQAHAIVNGHPNEFVKTVSQVPALQAFSAVIYSAFDDEQL